MNDDIETRDDSSSEIVNNRRSSDGENIKRLRLLAITIVSAYRGTRLLYFSTYDNICFLVCLFALLGLIMFITGYG